MLLGNIFLPQREATGKRPDFDFVGFALLATAIGSLLTGLSNGQREGWDSNFVIVLVFLSMGCGAGFIWWELRARQPLVELRVLGNGQFTAAASVAFIFGLGLFGTTYLVPLFVQLIQKYTPLAAGLLLMPGGLILGAFMPIAGFMSDRAPPRTMIMAGLVCFGVSTFLMAAVDANMSFWTIAWLVVLSRIGLALIKPSLNLAALRPLRPEQVTQGAGMINFARQLGGAFGVNALSVTLDRRTMLHSEAFTSTQSAANSATAELLHQTQALLAQAGVSPDAQAAGALHYLGRVLTAQAYTAGFQDSFLLCGFIFTAALIPAWIMGMRRRAPPAQAA
jgi:EmrB/QacA subfamily drug resistance transporter